MLIENEIISHKLTDSQKVDLIALHFPEAKVIQYAASKNIVETLGRIQMRKETSFKNQKTFAKQNSMFVPCFKLLICILTKMQNEGHKVDQIVDEVKIYYNKIVKS